MPRPTVECSGWCARRISVGWQRDDAVFCGTCLPEALAKEGLVARVEIRSKPAPWTVPTQAGF